VFSLPDHAEEYSEVLAAVGLAAPSAHAKLIEASEGELPRIFDAARRLGATTIIDPGVRERWAETGGPGRIADRLNELAARAAEEELRIGYHNHWWEFSDLGGRPALEAVADRLDPKVVLEIDTYWAQVGGVDAPALVRRLGSRVGFLHVKDGPLTEDVRNQLPAGQGCMDIPAILAAAPSAARILEFDGYAGDIFHGLADSRRAVLAFESTVVRGLPTPERCPND
jgi:sugar phosphate isomerase/epimerase